MTRFEDALRQGLHAFGADAKTAELLDRSLATSRRLRRSRALAAATASAVIVAGIGVGAWALATPERDGSLPAITTPTPTQAPTARPTVAPSSPQAARSSAPPIVTAAVSIVWCPTDDVRDHLPSPPSPPSGLTTVTLPLPSSFVGKVAQYEDATQHDAVLAPIGWECSAMLAEDGSSSLVVSPSIDKQTGSATARKPVVSVYKSGASTVQAAEGACPLVIGPTALINGETCSKRPAGETSTKIDAYTTAFVDPPTPTNPYETVGRMTYLPQNPVDMLQVLSCSVPSAQRQVCDSGQAGMTVVK